MIGLWELKADMHWETIVVGITLFIWGIGMCMLDNDKKKKG